MTQQQIGYMNAVTARNQLDIARSQANAANLQAAASMEQAKASKIQADNAVRNTNMNFWTGLAGAAGGLLSILLL